MNDPANGESYRDKPDSSISCIGAQAFGVLTLLDDDDDDDNDDVMVFDDEDEGENEYDEERAPMPDRAVYTSPNPS